MKEMVKNIVLIFLFLIITCFCTNINIVHATDEDEPKPEDSPVYDYATGYNFQGLDKKGTTGSLGTATQNVMGTIINVIRVVGTGIAIIMLTYVAIKYMSAAPSEKAEFKKSATAYIVGAIVLMGTTNLLKIIADFATTNIK